MHHDDKIHVTLKHYVAHEGRSRYTVAASDLLVWAAKPGTKPVERTAHSYGFRDGFSTNRCLPEENAQWSHFEWPGMVGVGYWGVKAAGVGMVNTTEEGLHDVMACLSLPFTT